ncbi:MAG: PDZ domain-containing protein, partial [Bacteroidetes bacterium]
ARIIGTDMATDLALIKIEGADLPTAQLAVSDDQVELGDWVLAIGNPFDLVASVTAGIVSGKGRNINLLRHDVTNQKNAVESFIQTDAAINPGNSGGALINMRGEVVGINTAIATHTGYYSGFSFAIPIGLVRKVVADLKEHGETKRAILGVKLMEIDSKVAMRKSLRTTKGVMIDYVAEHSSASFAGLQAGDVISAIDKKEVNTVPDFNARIALYAPNQKITLTYHRKGVEKIIQVHLLSTVGKIPDKAPKTTEGDSQIWGAELTLPTATEKKRLGIKTGVKVQKIQAGKLQSAGIKTGFIITQIDKKNITLISEVKTILAESKKNSKTITIEGYYWGEGKAYYALGW